MEIYGVAFDLSETLCRECGYAAAKNILAEYGNQTAAFSKDDWNDFLYRCYLHAYTDMEAQPYSYRYD